MSVIWSCTAKMWPAFFHFWQISGQCEQSGSRGERAWKILNIGQDLSEESSTPGKFCEIWYRWSIVYVHHHLDVARQLHQEMAISDQYLVSSKVRMSNTPKFPSLSSPSLILKGFWDQDARILPCTMFSGQCKQSGSRGERAWKILNIGQDLSEESSTPGKFCEIWYRWSILYPSSPWRGETAASRDGNSGRVPRIIQSSNEQHSQVSVTFVTFTHPERVLILGSGCKAIIALYNVQGSISRSWQISGQCKQSGSRGERA